MEDNKNWIYVGMAVVAVVAIIGLSFFYNTPNTAKQTQTPVNQNTGQNQVTNNQPAVNTDIDSLLNDLDSQENQVNQSLNDQPADVLSDN
jgi:peptidoglycan hydrolase CwlO-like protein